jgi:hypothetical protein
VTVAANTGTQTARIAPGANGALGSIGTLRMASLSVSGGDLQFDLVSPGTSDFADITGPASFTAPSRISPGPSGQAGTYTLLTAAGGLTACRSAHRSMPRRIPAQRLPLIRQAPQTRSS